MAVRERLDGDVVVSERAVEWRRFRAKRWRVVVASFVLSPTIFLLPTQLLSGRLGAFLTSLLWLKLVISWAKRKGESARVSLTTDHIDVDVDAARWTLPWNEIGSLVADHSPCADGVSKVWCITAETEGLTRGKVAVGQGDDAEKTVRALLDAGYRFGFIPAGVETSPVPGQVLSLEQHGARSVVSRRSR